MNRRLVRLPLLLLAIFGLLAALWAGWIRIGWPWPPFQRALPANHGPLMISAFLGTLIVLERAVAMERPWMYAGPLLSGAGGLLLVFGAPETLAAGLVCLGSLVFILIYIQIIRQQRALYTVTMGFGAVAWFVGNLIWLFGGPIYQSIWWWAAFLVLTVAGERLELGRIQRLPEAAARMFIAGETLLLGGAALSDLSFLWGSRLVGLGLLVLAFWGLRYDIARRTIRRPGLPRFVAAALLAGYAWMFVGGLLAVRSGGQAAGPYYDAILHAIFVGFVMSMIFGHAPIIFPAVLGLEIRFTPWLYLPLALLHTSLILRLAGDLALLPGLRMWGGLLNGIAILLYFAMFLVNLIYYGTRLAKTSPTA